jgi:hypothetical protein
VLVNRIPKDGGPISSAASSSVSSSNGKFQGDNIDSELNRRGIRSVTSSIASTTSTTAWAVRSSGSRVVVLRLGPQPAYNNYVANAFNPDGSRAGGRQPGEVIPGRITAQLSRKDR